jgi:hypothetical protein
MSVQQHDPYCRLCRRCRHVTGGDLEQIATRRLREAGQSTAIHNTGGARSEIEMSPAYEYNILVQRQLVVDLPTAEIPGCSGAEGAARGAGVCCTGMVPNEAASRTCCRSATLLYQGRRATAPRLSIRRDTRTRCRCWFPAARTAICCSANFLRDCVQRVKYMHRKVVGGSVVKRRICLQRLLDEVYPDFIR